MGAGKTSVGQALAAELDLPYVDLDQKIVALAGKSIPKIFHDEGESVFRDLESSVLFDLSGSPPSVVATGGGIIGRSENRAFMFKHGTVLYLFAQWETLKQRIGATAERPLAQSDQDWIATKELLSARSPLYEQADIIIVTDHRTIPDIVTEIRSHAKL